MQYTRIDDATRVAPSVLAIGNFDGVHRGHAAVIQRVIHEAHKRSNESALLTFDPHPASVLGRTPPPLLTSLDRKSFLAKEMGINRVFVRNFDEEFSRWSPEKFATDLLGTALHAALVVVGDNFRFGHKRAGDLETLRRCGQNLGFEILVFPAVGDERGAFSSTRVREALLRGDVIEAAQVLGRSHRISGVVKHGAERGRTIGFPTANLGDVIEMVPGYGVYAVRVEHDDSVYGGVMNVGVRPTVDGTRVSYEANLFDFDGDLYGQRLTVDFLERIRGERKFSGLDALREQIGKDAEAARAIVKRVSGEAK